ncbi:hypothetical protein EVAR_10282_1 [Eumeta japonica]|uniref:Uncharacterized protein n=1 Tax=Eumeta variegata TaxID=151549 RepID=A0A4C1TEJ3_EUMVA|nr:hypothetical protein EVAR_10282_1 [Eumeta japonica]
MGISLKLFEEYPLATIVSIVQHDILEKSHKAGLHACQDSTSIHKHKRLKRPFGLAWSETCIWNPKYVNHKDKKKVADAWSRLAESSRASYGDDAISYVQLKRDAHLCTVKCKMCPEHKVHAKLYGCTLIIDEEDDVIVSVVCEDCVASRGGCKHAIAFYFGFTVVARSLLVHQPSAIGKIKVV